MKKMLLVMVMAVCAATAPAANLLWVASGVDSNWTTANNFNEIGTLNYPLPAPGDLVLIGHPTVSSWGPPWPVLTSSAQIGMLGLGWWGNCLGTPELTIGTGGALVVTDFTRMSLDAGGGNNTTIINVNGGSLTTGVLEMGYTVGSNSKVNINAGYVHAGSLTFGAGLANIDLKPGAYLFITGNVTSSVQTWIQQGKITGSGGQYNVGYSYDTPNPGLTAVYTTTASSSYKVDVMADGDCESGIVGVPGWGYLGGTAVFVNGVGVNGSKCIQITANSNVYTNLVQNIGFYKGVEGDAYTLKLTYKTQAGFTDGGDNYAQIRFWDSDSAYVSAATFALPATGGQWQTISFPPQTCPASAVWLDVVILIGWSGYSAGVVSVDDVQLYQTFNSFPPGGVLYWQPDPVTPDPTNWNIGGTSGRGNWAAQPTPGNHVIIGNPYVNLSGVWPVVDRETLPVAILAVGWHGQGVPYTHNKLYITQGGKITVSGLNYTGIPFMRLGYEYGSEGVVYMDGGELTTPILQVGYDGDGTFNQSGGVVRINAVNGLAFPSQLGGLGEGLYNMTGDAVLLLYGDSVSRINQSIANGELVAYNGTRPLVVDYNVINPGWTTVKPAACATLPTADLNKDCKVDKNDLILLASEWLDDASIPIQLVWEATMDTDPVLADNWALRTSTSNGYYMNNGKMVIEAGTLGGLNAVVDTAPANYFVYPLEIWATMRTLTISPSPNPITNTYGTTIWIVTDTDKPNFGINRFTVYRTSSTQQTLALVSNENAVLAQLTGFGAGMISVHATVVQSPGGGTITFDATDGTTSYTNQVVNYTNGLAGPVPGGSFVSISGLGYEGEVDYLKVATIAPRTIKYNLAGDPDKVNLQDFAVLAANWLTDNTN